MKTVLCTAAALALLTTAATADEVRGNIVTCTGVLVNINQPHGAPPNGVVFDDSGDFSCLVDRRGAERDPLMPCIHGHPCRVSGTFTANGRTYDIQELTVVERLR